MSQATKADEAFALIRKCAIEIRESNETQEFDDLLETIIACCEEKEAIRARAAVKSSIQADPETIAALRRLTSR